ncbi:hypothetical protein HELRODRAFT_189846 [Helobdella robusta]|uniref:Rotatin N-terminal domain-containing protein n=1 Tax=Helobdella robusta TaxID=6412 RepID=T1FRF1_HELRO|nr:hypothetical protein HELRODRAFT_189846 [Helobdella robusta]ESN90365.1 hypothetical protein HELRODRAFT_189846 [Helobdella robusta]
MEEANLKQLFAKLGHSLEEIRVRALKNLLMKVKLGLVSDEVLSTDEYLHTRILDWFNLKNNLMVDEVLNLITQLIKHPQAATSFIKLGAIEFLTALKSDFVLTSHITMVEDIIDSLAKCNLHEEHYDEYDVGFKLTYKPAKVSQIQESFPVPSTAQNISHENIEDMLDESLHSYPPDDECIHSRYKFPAEPDVADHPGNVLFSWIELTDADLIVLNSVVNLLKSRSTLDVVNVCSLLEAVIFHDYPAEVFLQRPNILQILLTLLLNATETMNNSSNASTTTSSTMRSLFLSDAELDVSIAVVTTLGKFCEVVKKRISQYVINPDYFKTIYELFPDAPGTHLHNTNATQSQLTKCISSEGDNLNTPHTFQWTIPCLCIELFETQRMEATLRRLDGLRKMYHCGNVWRAAEREKQNKQLTYVAITSASIKLIHCLSRTSSLSVFSDAICTLLKSLTEDTYLKYSIPRLAEQFSILIRLVEPIGVRKSTNQSKLFLDSLQSCGQILYSVRRRHNVSEHVSDIDCGGSEIVSDCLKMSLGPSKDDLIDPDSNNNIDELMLLKNVEKCIKAFYSLKYHKSLDYIDHSIALISQSSSLLLTSDVKSCFINITEHLLSQADDEMRLYAPVLYIFYVSLICLATGTPLYSVAVQGAIDGRTTCRPRGWKFGTWNVSTLTGRSLEVVEELQRRKGGCKGEGTRFVGAKGGRYKLWWKGDDGTGRVGGEGVGSEAEKQWCNCGGDGVWESNSEGDIRICSATKSGEHRSMIDYILVRAKHRKYVKNVKAIPGMLQHSMIQNACYEIILHVLQCKLITPPNFWLSVVKCLHSIVPSLSTACSTDSTVTKCLIGLFHGGQDDGSLQDGTTKDLRDVHAPPQRPNSDHLMFWLCLMFNKHNGKLRHQATNVILDILSREESSEEKYPRLSAVVVDRVANMFAGGCGADDADADGGADDKNDDTVSTALRHGNIQQDSLDLSTTINSNVLKISRADYVTKSVCKERDILKLLNAMSSSENMNSIEVLTSCASQLAVMLFDTSLHQSFARNGGTSLVISLLMSSILQCNSWNGRLRMVMKLMQCLMHVVLWGGDARKDMCLDEGVYHLLFRYCLMFASQGNREALTHTSCILFMLIMTRYGGSGDAAAAASGVSGNPHMCAYHQTHCRHTDVGRDVEEVGEDDFDVSKSDIEKPDKYLVYISKYLNIPFNVDFLICTPPQLTSVSSSSASSSLIICQKCLDETDKLINGLNEQMDDTRWLELEARMIWNVGLYNGSNNLVAAVARNLPDDQTLDKLRYISKLNLTPDDKLYLLVSSPLVGMRQTVDDVNMATAHLPVLNGIIRLHFYTSHFHSNDDVISSLTDAGWMVFLKRFLSVRPSSSSDYSLFVSILDLLTSVINRVHKDQLLLKEQVRSGKVGQMVSWMVDNTLMPSTVVFELFSKIMKNDSLLVTFLNEHLIKSIRTALLEYINCITCLINDACYEDHQHQLMNSFYAVHVEFLKVLNETLKDAHSVRSDDIITLMKLLQIYTHITARPGWSDAKRHLLVSAELPQTQSSFSIQMQILKLTLSYLKRIIETFHEGRGGDRSSYIGRGVFRSAAICLSHLCPEMSSCKNSENWPEFWSSADGVNVMGNNYNCNNIERSEEMLVGGVDVIDDVLTSTTSSFIDVGPDYRINFDWLLSLLYYRDVESCRAGMSVAAMHASTKLGRKLLMDHMHFDDPSDNLWSFALKIFLDGNKCLLIRREAALLLASMTSCDFNSDYGKITLKMNFKDLGGHLDGLPPYDDGEELLDSRTLFHELKEMNFFTVLISHFLSNLTAQLYRHENTAKRWQKKTCRRVSNINCSDKRLEKAESHKFSSLSIATSSLLSPVCIMLSNLIIQNSDVVVELFSSNVVSHFISLFNVIAEVVTMNRNKQNPSRLFELSSEILQLLITAITTSAGSPASNVRKQQTTGKAAATQKFEATSAAMSTVKSVECKLLTKMFDDVFLNQLVLSCCLEVRKEAGDDLEQAGGDHLNELVTSCHRLIIIILTHSVFSATRTSLLTVIQNHWTSLSNSFLNVLNHSKIDNQESWFSTLNLLTVLSVEEGELQDEKNSFKKKFSVFRASDQLLSSSSSSSNKQDDAKLHDKNNLLICLSLVKKMNTLSVDLSSSSVNCKLALYETLKNVLVVCHPSYKLELLKAGLLDMIFNQIDFQLNCWSEDSASYCWTSTANKSTSYNEKVCRMELLLLVGMLNNFMYKSLDVKLAVCLNADDSTSTAASMKRRNVMMRMMTVMSAMMMPSPKHNKHNDTLATSLLSLLVCFTSSCVPACTFMSSSLPTTSLVNVTTTTTAARKQALHQTVLNMILKFISTALADDNSNQLNSTRQSLTLKMSFQFLNNVVVCPEVRSVISKSSLLSDFVKRVNQQRLYPMSSRTPSTADQLVDHLFLSFICHITFTADGQVITSKVQGLILTIIDYSETFTSSATNSSSLLLSFMIIRNLSFHRRVRAKLLSNDKVVSTMLRNLEQFRFDQLQISTIACDCILNMVLHSQKVIAVKISHCK